QCPIWLGKEFSCTALRRASRAPQWSRPCGRHTHGRQPRIRMDRPTSSYFELRTTGNSEAATRPFVRKPSQLLANPRGFNVARPASALVVFRSVRERVSRYITDD